MGAFVISLTFVLNFSSDLALIVRDFFEIEPQEVIAFRSVRSSFSRAHESQVSHDRFDQSQGCVGLLPRLTDNDEVIRISHEAIPACSVASRAC